MLLPDGRETYNTVTGGAFFLFFTVIVFIYARSNGLVLINREGYSLVEMVNEDVYTPSKISFSHDNGFAVAAAITYGDVSWD